jgi:hypothetical protein
MGVPEPSLPYALSITCFATGSRKVLKLLLTLLQMEPFVEPLIRMRLGLVSVVATNLERLPLMAGLTPLGPYRDTPAVGVDSCTNSVVVEKTSDQSGSGSVCGSRSLCLDTCQTSADGGMNQSLLI